MYSLREYIYAKAAPRSITNPAADSQRERKINREGK